MYQYKKLLGAKALASISAPALCMSSILVAQADTLVPNAVYRMTLNSGCFAFAVDCGGAAQNVPSGGTFDLTTTQLNAMDNTVAGSNFTVGNYSIAAYTGTPGGLFSTGGPVAGSGTIDAAGTINLDFAGRTGSAQLFPFLGTPAWNIDDAVVDIGEPSPPIVNTNGTNAHAIFTTEDSSFRTVPSLALTVTGERLGAVTPNVATIVSASNIGTVWGPFTGTPYTEIYRLTASVVSADPFAVDDTANATQALNTVINVADLIANDQHAGGEVLTLTAFDAVSTGGGTIVADNMNPQLATTLTYNSGAGPVGPDTFTYTVSDLADAGPGGAGLSTATVTVTVIAGNPPIANDDAVAGTEDTVLVVDPVGGMTAGVVIDTDPEMGPLALTAATDVLSAQNGTVSFVGNDITYTPLANFNGVDTFNYTIIDNEGATDSAVVTVTVAAVNDGPACTDVAVTTAIDASLDIDVATELLDTTSMPPLCTDVEGDAVTLDSFDAMSTQGGTISTDGAGTLTYTPPSGYEGEDTFTFTPTDGADAGAANTVTVNVADPNLSNFTMLNSAGNTFGGTNDVIFEWDGTSFNVDENDTTVNATMRSQGPQPFFGSPWTAHHIRMFGPGTYTFDTTCNKADMDAGKTDCNRPFSNPAQTQQFLTVTVGPGQVGGLVFFDYTTTEDIDVFMVWERNAPWDTQGDTAPKNALFTGEAGVPPDPATDWELVSTDGDGDGINGIAMIDGSFIGFAANFNIGPGGTAEPVPPITDGVGDTALGKSSLSVWGILVSVFSLFGLRRFQNRVVK